MSYPYLFDPTVFREATPITKLFLLIFITISSFIILGFIFILLAIPAFGFSFSEINKLFNDPLLKENLGFVKYFQTTQSIALFVVPAIILNFLLFKGPDNFLSQKKQPSFYLFVLVILLLGFSLPFIEKTIQWNQMISFPDWINNKFNKLESEASDVTDKLLSGKTLADLFINIFILAIIPAIGEEFFFRGVIQRIFNDWFKNGHYAIIISAFLFSCVHLQFYGFIPRMILGIFFGYLFYWSKNIWLPVTGHFINNTIAVIVQFLSTSETSRLHEKFTFIERYEIPLIIISIMFTCITLYLIRKECSRKFTIQHL
jgi:uncharacterized protein